MKKFIASLFQGLKLFACADVSKRCGGGGGGGQRNVTLTVLVEQIDMCGHR